MSARTISLGLTPLAYRRLLLAIAEAGDTARIHQQKRMARTYDDLHGRLEVAWSAAAGKRRWYAQTKRSS